MSPVGRVRAGHCVSAIIAVEMLLRCVCDHVAELGGL